MRARAILVCILLLVLASTDAATGPQGGAPSHVTSPVTSPREQFGAAVGDDYFLATFTQLDAYWRTLDRESDRLLVVDIGATEEGRRQPMAIVSAPANLRALDRYRDISRRLARAEGLTDAEARALAAEGKAVVAIAGGLHADETLGAQQLIETVYQLVSRDDAETMRLLRDTIVLAIHANPDGHELVAGWYMREADPRRRSLARVPRLYQKYAGHDNNRDFYTAALAETANINRVLYHEWFPQIVYDHHQTAPAGSVMFAPPFRGPFNAVLHPSIPEGIEVVATAMHDRFASEGKAGITSREGGTYSVWWNGGLRTTAYFHNQIGLLTETFGGPTPATSPFGPGMWHFRDSLDYSLTANRAVLDAASRHRESLLFNAYRMGRDAIDAGSSGIRAYVVPADQPDFPTATKFVDALVRSGIAVHRAASALTAGGRRYPAGSFVVSTAQAFRPHVLDMFEAQVHPDDFPVPGGAPRPPYDNAGWTLAFQMGVRFDRVTDAVEGRLEAVAGAATPQPGSVVWQPPPGAGSQPAGFVVSHAPNDVFVVINRLLQAGERVYSIGGDRIYVAGRSALPLLQAAANELGLTFTGVAQPPAGDARQVRPVRVGLADNAGGSVPSGWVRWVLERFEFPFEVAAPEVLEDGSLDRYDVLILPDDVVPGRRALTRLRRFVEDGGTLIAMGRATGVASVFELPVTDPLAGVTREQYFVPGSVLRARVDTTRPAAFGFEAEVDVFFDNSPVFRLEAGAAARGVRPIAWFATAAPLRSGWAWGQANLQGAVAALDAPVGRGRLVLFGPQVTFRAQSHGTFKFLFNSIYFGAARPMRLR